MTDWERIERSDEFRELVKRRRSFVVPATIFFLVAIIVSLLQLSITRGRKVF